MRITDEDIHNRMVFVIGGAGFLGSHLVDYLIANRRCSVVVLDNLSTGHRKFVNREATLIEFDVRDNKEQLADIFRDKKAEYVFNYAAMPFIPDSFSRPEDVFEVNVMGVLNILYAASRVGVEKILQVGSAEVSGGSYNHMSLEESTFLEPKSTYGVSKFAAEMLVKTRFHETRVPVVGMRQFNAVGERETHPYVVTDIISQLSNGSEVKLGNNSSRDFLYAGDAVRMAVELLEKGLCGEIYNMGSQQSIDIYQLAEMIGALMGKPDCEVVFDQARVRPWEVWSLLSNNKKLYDTILGRPTTSLKTALQQVIKYWRDNGERWDFSPSLLQS